MGLMPQPAPTPDQAPTLTPDDLLLKHSNKIKDVLEREVVQRVDNEKTYRYASIRRNDLYWRGHQYVSLSYSGEGFVDFRPLEGSTLLSPSADYDDVTDGGFDYVFNIYKGYIRKLTALIGQRQPNVKGLALIRDDDAAVRRSNIATKAASYIEQTCNVQDLHRQAVFGLAKSGTVFSYAAYKSDGELFGHTVEPVLEPQEQKIGEDEFVCPECQYEGPMSETIQDQGANLCPECGTILGGADVIPAPTQTINAVTDYERYQNGSVEIAIATELEVTTPFYIKKLDDAPWLRYQYEMDKGKLLSMYPQLRSKAGVLDTAYTGWGQSGAMGRFSRSQLTSPTGVTRFPRPQLWLYERFWLRPSMYEYFGGSDEDDNLRHELYRAFPRGLKITLVNGELVDVDHESLTEVWAACKPEESDYLYPESYLEDVIRYQDLVNDSGNIVVEGMERMIGVTFADPTVIDPSSINEKGRLSGEYIFTQPHMGGDLKNSLYHTKLADVDPKIMDISDFFIGNMQDVTGLVPSVWGAGAGVETVGQERILRDQALAMLSTMWNNLRSFWSRTYENAIMQLARYSPDDQVYFPVRFPDQTIPMQLHGLTSLTEGGWSMKADENMPMNTGQIQSYVLNIVTQMAPELQQMLGFFHPSNVGRINQILGLPDLKNPALDAYNRIQDTIYQLLQQAPMQDVDPYTGEQIESPSIPPDTFLFDPGIVAEVIREWALSEAGQNAEQTNPEGFRNVILYAMEYMNILNAQAAPPAEGEDGGEPGAEGPEEQPPAPGPGQEGPAPEPEPPAEEQPPTDLVM